VTIEDKVTLGGLCAVNQFVRIGKHAFLGGASMINKDILPFCIAQGNYAVVRATNKIGLERSGFSDEAIQQVNRAVRIITKGSKSIDEALERIAQECEPLPEVKYLVDFIKSSTRGLGLEMGS
jgi:UDP-N-acetylglucosamine acyltransferase